MGETFELKINGVPTKRSAPFVVNDSEGVTDTTTHWGATAKRKLCFEINARDSGFGEFTQVGVVIHEIRQDRPIRRWRNFQPLPNPNDDGTGVASWLPGMAYCPEEFILTRSLRQRELPAGIFVFKVTYHGAKNWDAQHIFVAIEE